jgi:hypothetical protein
VLQPCIQALSARSETVTARSETVTQLLGDTKWDVPGRERITAFSKLVKLLDDALTSVADFRQVMPPIEWRAVHRELARAAVEQLRGQIQITLTIAAPDFDAALRQREAGSQSLDRGTRHLARATAIRRITDTLDAGPFQADGSIDMAMVSWTAVGREATSIPDAAEIVRSAYSDVPGMSDLPQPYAVLLLPMLATAARVTDHDLLVGRARQLRAVLDQAGASAGWISESELLVDRLQRGLDRITAETERLGREWRHKHRVRTLCVR